MRIVIYNYRMDRICISSMRLLLGKKVTRPDPGQRILEIEDGDEKDLIAIYRTDILFIVLTQRPTT